MGKRLIIYFLFLAQIAQTQNYVSFLDVEATNKKADEIRFANTVTIPFIMVEGMMVVKAAVNHQMGNFIIDTGAPTLVLNERPTKAEKINGRGISKSLLTAEIKVQDFAWSGIAIQDIVAFKVDISHLEAVSGKELAGIIGYDILKEVELLVDYGTQTVQLSPVKSKLANVAQPIAVIPFTMQAHLPVIKVKIGKKKLRLALDTASETNILDEKLFKKLNTELMDDSRVGEIQGVDQQIKKVLVANIKETNIKGLPFETMPYLFTDLSHLRSESGLYIDGLLGYPFFKQGKMSINYKEKKIYVWSKD